MLTVTTDFRARALSAALAATDWPEREQRPKPRGVHHEASALKKYAEPFRAHPAARYVQAALDADRDPLPLFVHALSDSPELSAHLREFSVAAKLDSYWAEHDTAWAQAVAEVQAHVKSVDFASMLIEACGAAPLEMIILPNLVYPTGLSLGFSASGRTYSLMPPRKAVGESPPWPFSDDRDHVLKLAINDFCSSVLAEFLNQHPGLLPETSAYSDRLPASFRAAHSTWPRQIAKFFTYGVTAVFLNRIEAGEGDALVLYDSRTKDLPILPDAIRLVSDYFRDQAGGKIHGLADFLPHFAEEVSSLLTKSKP